MNKFYQLVSSRTFWTIVALVVVNTVTQVHDLIPAHAIPYVDVILGMLASWLHINPSQKYTLQK